MKVEFEVVHHPKFLRLKKAVGPEAMEFLVRLWGHCETAQRGEYWRGADSSYVELICCWQGEAGVLFKCLVDFGWLKVEEKGLRVNDWNAHNWRRVVNWETGRKGGRPKGTQSKPNDNPRDTIGKPNDNPMKTPLNELNELNDIEGGGPESGAQPDLLTSCRGNHPGTIPPDGEVLNFAVKWPGEAASGTPKMPVEFVREWLAKMNGRTVGWPLLWDRALVAEWRSKHATWGKKRVNGTKNGAPNMLDLKTQLQAIERRMVTHPANEESATFGGQVTAEEQAEFDNLVKMKGEIERKLRGDDTEAED